MDYLCRLITQANAMPLCDMSLEEQRLLLEKVLQALNPILYNFSDFIALNHIKVPRYEGDLYGFLHAAGEFCQTFTTLLERESLLGQNIKALAKYLASKGVECSKLSLVNIAKTFDLPITNPEEALYAYFSFTPESLDGRTIYYNLTESERERTGFTSFNPVGITAVGLQSAIRIVQERLFLTILRAELLCQ